MTFKEAVTCCIQAIVIGLVFSIAISVGAIFMGIVARNVNKTEITTVESQHQKLIDSHDYLYCPYCGQRLEREDKDANRN